MRTTQPEFDPSHSFRDKTEMTGGKTFEIFQKLAKANIPGEHIRQDLNCSAFDKLLKQQ